MIFAPSKVGISGWHSLLQSHLLVGSDLHRPGEPAAEVPGLESGRCLCGECRSAGVAVGWDVLRTPVVYLCNVEIQKGGQMMWDRSWSYDHRYGVRFFWIKVERGELSNKSMWVFLKCLLNTSLLENQLLPRNLQQDGDSHYFDKAMWKMWGLV